MNDKVKVDIKDEEGKELFTGVIHPLTVALDSRRLELVDEVLKRNVSDKEKGVLMTCAALASSLHNEEGTLLYPSENAVDKVHTTMSAPVYGQLVSVYLEINPISPTLEVKKNKY